MGPTRKRVLDKACEAAGSLSNLADKLKVTRQTIYNWRKAGKVPAHHAVKIAQVTCSAVTVHDLRPDLW